MGEKTYMKNFKLLGVIALAAIIVFSMTGCDNGTTSPPPATPPTTPPTSPPTPPPTLESISAVFAKTTAITESTPLNDLKSNLTVTAYYSNKVTETVDAAEYTLSGILLAPRSMVAVSYAKNGITKTTKFLVMPNGLTPANVNGFYAEDGVYDIIEYDGRKNVIKIDGVKAQETSVRYFLEDYLGLGITVNFSAEVMREGTDGYLPWQINHIPENSTIAAEWEATADVWYPLSGELTIPYFVSQYPELYMYLYSINPENTTYYIVNPTVTIVTDSALDRISAEYTPTGTVMPDRPLNDLKSNLTVTGHYSNNTTKNISVNEYTLSGALTVPESTITVSYTKDGVTTTTTFTVTVSPIPELTGTVSISGTAKVFETLTANTGSLNGSGTITYQWKRGTANIGVNSSMYFPQTADIGSPITVTVTRSGYSGSITSGPTAAVVPATLDVINVLDYGVVSGSGDSTDAIQAAIDAAQDGDTIYFPNGVYFVSKQITLKSEITLKGESQNGAVLEVPYKSQGIDGNGSLVHIPPMASNIEIANLTFFGNDGFPVEYVIHIENADNIKIHHVTIKNFDQNVQDKVMKGIDVVDRASNIEVSNCAMDSLGPMYIYGGGVQFNGYVTGIVIQDNVFTNMGRGGIFVANSCTDIIIRRNIVTGLKRISDPENAMDGIMGIELWGGPQQYCERAVVEDNEIDYWMSISGSNIAVRRNIIGKNAVGKNYVALEANGKNHIFTDNVLTKHKAGIGIWGNEEDFYFSYSYFGRNSARDMSWIGMLIASPWKNTDSRKHRYLYFKDCEFIGTTGTDGEGSGVGFWTTSEYITFDNCRMNENAGLGVRFSDYADVNNTDHISFVDCTIKDNNGAFFYPWGEGNHTNYTAIEFQNLTISGNLLSNETFEEKPFINVKPVAVINGPATGNVGQPLSFRSDSIDPDGSIGHILWDLDDGIPLNDNVVTHTYTKAGTYKVSLIVWDNEGRGSIAEKTVVIR